MQIEDSEYENLLRDAMRYRWLNENSTIDVGYDPPHLIMCRPWAEPPMRNAALDATIDAARSQGASK